jgi:hypothetical protein
MTISNQCLTVPPDHPLAKEMYDYQSAQSTIMAHLDPANPDYDAAKVEQRTKEFALVDGAIRFVQAQYRAERGGDESCTVGLTYGIPPRYPIVDGRPSDGSPFIHPRLVVPPVRN